MTDEAAADVLPPDLVTACVAALMSQGEYRVTDNGDGTYTHEWTAQPRDDSGEDSQP